MSTPITFSGFNDIDFNLVVNSLMQHASLPLTSLQNQQKALQTQSTNLDKLSSLVGALNSAAGGLGTPANLSTLAGTSSDDAAVGVSTSAGVLAGGYDVVVNELARSQVTVSASSVPDANTTLVATGGSITIGGVTVTLPGGVTLQQLATAINGTAGIGVTASVIRTSASSYRLALVSVQPGATNAFTLSNALTGGTGVTFTDTDQDGISGNSAADNAVVGTDASMLINNIPVTNSTNVFADVMPGVTLTARRKDPASVVRVDVATDTTAIKERIQTFVDAYNELVKFAGEQRTAAANGEASSIGRSPVLRALHLGLRTAMISSHGAGTLTRVAEAGVELTSTGQLKLNDAVLDAAVASDSGAVTQLFAGTTGAFTEVGTLLDGYQQANGLISTGKKQIERQINVMTEQIATMQRRLALERESLQRQFSEADLMMSRLKSQASSLSGLGSGFGSL